MVSGKVLQMIGILDLNLGNLRSVSNAVYNLGYDFSVVTHAEHFETISHLIIPGVGSFDTAMQYANALQIKETVQSFAKQGKPVLGICLGMQLLADYGEEGGGSEGFGLIRGNVVKMTGAEGMRLPHVGWNTVILGGEHPVLHKCKDKVDYYFVHSYHLVCSTARNIIAKTEYGAEFCSIVAEKNVIGFQFHPEKSQNNGLLLLENFCEWDGKW